MFTNCYNSNTFQFPFDFQQQNIYQYQQSYQSNIQPVVIFPQPIAYYQMTPNVIQIPETCIHEDQQISSNQTIPVIQTTNRQLKTQKRRQQTNLIKTNTKNLKKMKLALFNAHSIGDRSKRIIIKEFLFDEDIDILVITETWLRTTGDEVKLRDITPCGYKIKSVPRATKGGGIAVVYKEHLHPTFYLDFEFDHASFELVHLSINKPQHINIFCMYRPPPSTANGLLNSTFINELPDFLEHTNTLRGKTLILGDINVHFNHPTDWLPKRVIDTVSTYSFTQGVKEATFYRSGNIVDWVLYREEEQLVKECTVNHMLSSDHASVVCTLNDYQPKKDPIHYTYRNIKDVNIDDFKRDVKEMTSKLGADLSAEELNEGLQNVLNQHAPEESKCRPPGRSSDWFPFVREELKTAKRIRRRAERKWRKSRLQVDRQVLDDATRRVSSIVDKGEIMYWKSKITTDIKSKELYMYSNFLLGRSKLKIMPTNIPLNEQSDTFSKYFHDKVRTLRSELDKIADIKDPLLFDKPCSSSFTNFKEISQDDVQKIILNSNSKSCSLDPIPTSLLKQCINELLPSITYIINTSLKSSTFPFSYKHALVTPLLKKSNLDPNILKNYRPVSNLPFLSKITEKVVLKQLKEYLDENNLLPINQSAYKESHSTETALLRIMNDLLLETENDNISVLSLLDLSSAFDTIDHEILLQRLKFSYGIDNKALSWIQSYLSSRTQSVSTKSNLTSLPSSVDWGVPQGSVLGPILFIMYMKPLNSICQTHSIQCQSFADDSQIHSSSSANDVTNAFDKTQKCYDDIKDWMNMNKLKLNDDKTELLLIHSNHKTLSKELPSSIIIGNSNISFSKNAKNLGITLSDTLSLETHVNNTCRSAYAELRKIANIRPYLTLHATKILVCALVLSKLDYCNALYYSLPAKVIYKLEKVQNSAARVIFQSKKRDHITPYLQKLHWLPVSYRIIYKIACICFKAYTQPLFPQYLSELMIKYKPKRNLRSSNDSRLLVQSNTHAKRYGQRSFSNAAPKVWNSLPFSIRHSKNLKSFQTALKTHLFKKAYCL